MEGFDDRQNMIIWKVQWLQKNKKLQYDTHAYIASGPSTFFFVKKKGIYNEPSQHRFLHVSLLEYFKAQLNSIELIGFE